MINKAFFEYANEVAEDRGIDVTDVYESFKKGLMNSFKKEFGHSSCEVVIDPDHHEISMYSVHVVVAAYSEELEEGAMAEMLLEDAKKIKSTYKVGDIVKQAINIKEFNRTLAAATKSVFTQGNRTRQREVAYDYFKELENEMVRGTVTNIKENYVMIDLGRGVVTSIPKSELLPNDNPQLGDPINVYIRKVEMTTKEPKVSVSRTDRALVTRLMENYIPEIKSGVIEIKGIARDPGDRSKIALYSNDPHVDAIGSCVGEGGSRIREIVNALGGEKVDLYKWSEVPEELISNSLQPANVTKVLSVDVKNKSSVVVVPNEHLSLAIGKSGQNVRLAVQSCGWKIDIMSVSEAYEKGFLI
ncbi:MAG: transcription termination factor NusA [Acholeplasmatales bacterium]|nr:transcription termination factor NusA [Acholeplasmatales bacterium]